MNTERPKAIYLPFLIFLFLFVIDKAFLIKPVFERLVKNQINSYQGYHNMLERYYDAYVSKWMKQTGKSKEEIEGSQIIIFGTSRSADYAELSSAHYKGNPYLKQEEKTASTPVISWILKAGNFIHIYTSYLHFLEKYGKAKMLVIELNYPAFNVNTYRREKKEIYELSFDRFKEDYDTFTYKDKVEFFSSHFFMMNMYKIGWSRIFKKPNEFSLDNAMDFLMAMKKMNDQNAKPKTEEFSPYGIREGEENKEQWAAYEDYNRWVIAAFYTAFRLNETEQNLLEKTIKEASEKKIPLAFYRPRIHKHLREISTKLLPGEKEWYEKVYALCDKYGIPYLDLDQEGAMSCDYFTDTSHISQSCFPEVIEKLNDLYDKHYRK